MNKKQEAIATFAIAMTLAGIGIYLIESLGHIAIGVIFMMWSNNMRKS